MKQYAIAALAAWGAFSAAGGELNSAGQRGRVMLGKMSSETALFFGMEGGGMAVPSHLNSLNSLDGIRVLEISEYATNVPDGVFEGAKELSTVVLGKNLASIGKRAFADCPKLECVVFPWKLRMRSRPWIDLADDAFAGCSTNLTRVEVQWYMEARGRFSRDLGQRGPWRRRVEISRNMLHTFDAYDGISENGIFVDGDFLCRRFMYRREKENECSAQVLMYLGDARTVVVPEKLGGVPVRDIQVSLFPEGKKADGLVILPDLDDSCGFLRSLSCRTMHNSNIQPGTPPFRRLCLKCPSWCQFMYFCRMDTLDFGIDMFVVEPRDVKLSRQLLKYDAQRLSVVPRWVDGVEIVESGFLEMDGFRYLRRGAGLVVRRYVDGLRRESGEPGKDGCCDAVVPEYVDGLPVVEIWNSAFEGCGVWRVILPRTIQIIGRDAFSGCSNLERVVVPDGVEELPDGVFAGCSSLKEVSLPDSIVRISQHAFDGASVKLTFRRHADQGTIANSP